MAKIKTYVPIHLPPKHLDWEQLSFELGRAREHLARYDETLRTPPLSILEILKWEESIANIRSQNIESNLLEVLTFLVAKTEEEKRTLLLQKIVNAKEGLDCAIRSAIQKKPLNTSFLCHIHALVKKDAPNPKEIGCLRKQQNWIGTPGRPIEEAYFHPPKHHLVPKYLKDMFNYSLKKEEPLVQLAIIVAQLLIVHPFMDGNGRVARHYIPAFLYKKKLLSKPFLFLSAHFEDHRLQYLENLYNISDTSDWEKWILYFLRGVSLRSERMKSQVEKIKELYLKVGQEEPFVHPVSLKKKKILTEHPKGVFLFEPLFEAIQ